MCGRPMAGGVAGAAFCYLSKGAAMPTVTPTTDLTTNQGKFPLRFPALEASLGQDHEWCEVKVGGRWRTIRFHDYHEIYQVPGLYECLFYRTLKCTSPLRVVSMLRRQLREAGQTGESLRVLDVGAGNGMVGALAQQIGARVCVGVDIIPEARDAADRDRPWVYDDYVVADLTDLPEAEEERIRKQRLNCLMTVAALGFGDIPPKAFLTALRLVQTPAWLAFNVKEDFAHPKDATGFAALLQRLAAEDVIRIESYARYRHRLSTTGEPLHYIAVIATKPRDVPDELRGEA